MAGMKADVCGGSEVSPSQAVPLVGVPVFPNCIKFSDTNLLAVAAGHLVTILNPAALSGPRGFIPVTPSSLFDVGKVPQGGLQVGSLLPYILFRDPRPGVRSMDWSPSGLAQNGGCLLAVCTTDNRVKVYREPFSDFQSDWVEIMDVSEMAYNYCVKNKFRECELTSAQMAMKDDSMPPPSDWGLPSKRKHVEEHAGVQEPQHRKVQKRNNGLRNNDVGGKDLLPTSNELQLHPSDNLAQPAIPIQAVDRLNAATTLTSVEGGRPSSEPVLVREENAGVHPPVSGSVLEISNGEVLLRLEEHHGETIANNELERTAASSNLQDGGRQSIHEAGGLAAGAHVNDDLNEHLVSIVARSRKSPKIDARRRAADVIGSCSPSNAPEADTCLVENTSARPARMRKLPSRFLEGGELTETIPDSSLDKRAPGKSKRVVKEKRVTFEMEKNTVMYVSEETEKQVVEDVDVVELVKDVADPGEERLEGLNDPPSISKHGRRLLEKLEKIDERISITADYVARTELLSPLQLAWSPKCQAAERVDDEVCKRHKFALLGAGTKSGNVSIWRMMYPPCYSIDHVHRPPETSFLGFLEAHKSWVTNLCWASCNFDLVKVNMVSPNHLGAVLGEKLLLVTGCADGSVKVWAAHSDSLITASSSESLPFAFCKQVGKADSVPVTSLALVVLSQPSDRALLAVGKGSGSLAIYEITSSGVCEEVCHHNSAHEQTVTGLYWKFDGSCLYSCGQDSLKIWELLKAELKPVQFPDWSAVFPTIISPDLCSAEAMESFFGVALSHNCLALTTVRGLDSDVLDQMYQARSQKAILLMFWLGSTPADIKNYGVSDDDTKGEGMTASDIASWKVNILSALQHLEDPKKALVLWDVISALSLLKQAVSGEVVVGTISEWLLGWARGEDAVEAVEPAERQSRNFEKAVSEASCRQLHILNVIYRRILLVHLKPEVLNTSTSQNVSPTQAAGAVTREEKLWRKCIDLVEHELRQRLIYLRLCKATNEEEDLEQAHTGGFSGTLLTAKWVLDKSSSVFPELSKVATQLRKSHRNLFKYLSDTCPFCESAVALESPETACCQGSGTGTGDKKHHLQRCSVSMQVCPPMCQWYCGCCERRAIEQAPSLFFELSSRSQIRLVASSESDAYPACPFCGVLMYRLLPNFFLTPSLV